MFGGGGFTIRPRKGELIVYDKLARPLLSSIILPVPTARTKGVVVAPTVFGNVLLGPTAEDVTDRADRSTSAAGLSALLADGRRILPGLSGEEVTATYAGLRAATEHSDYQLGAYGRYVRVAGIRSTGLTASLGIAEHVAGLLGEAGLPLKPRAACAAAAPDALPGGGRDTALPGRGADRGGPGVRRDRLPLRAGQPRRDPRRARQRHPAGRARRAAAAHPRDERPVPGVLLRRGGVGAVRAPGRGRAMEADVLVVGAGPAGLTAAAELRRLGVPRVAGRRPGGGARRDPAAQRARRLRAARPAPGAVRPGLRAGAGGQRRPGRARELRAGCTVTGRCRARAAHGVVGRADQRRGHRGGARRRRCCSPPGAGSGPAPPGWSPATGRPACSPPANCSSASTSAASGWTAARSWSARST